MPPTNASKIVWFIYGSVSYNLKCYFKYYKSFLLTHLCRMDFFYHISLDQPISNRRGDWLDFTMLYRNSCIWCKRQTLIRCCVLWRLIWVYTVCKCPIYVTLGINGLICYFQRFWLIRNAHSMSAKRRNAWAKTSKKTQNDSVRTLKYDRD